MIWSSYNQYQSGCDGSCGMWACVVVVALVVDEKSAATSRVGYVKNADGEKVRLARQAKNKEIK